MKTILLALAASLILAIVPAGAAEPTGDWMGVVQATPAVAFRLAFHIRRGADGALAGSYDSLDRALYDAPLAEIVAEGDSLAFAVPSVQGRLKAK